LEPFKSHPALVAEDIVAGAIFRTQSRTVNARKRCKILPGSVPLGGEIGVTDVIAELVRITRIPTKKGFQRVALQVSLVARGKQCTQLQTRSGTIRQSGGGPGGEQQDERQDRFDHLMPLSERDVRQTITPSPPCAV